MQFLSFFFSIFVIKFLLIFPPIFFSANNAGYFKAEIEPIKMKDRKGGEKVFEVDEHPREATAELMAKLPPVFKKDGGLVNAGNASVGGMMTIV